MEYKTLRNGVKMPMEGFGVYQVPNGDKCKQVVLDAIDVGYYSIDTAAAYQNEDSVGDAIQESGISREELFITSKLWTQDAGYEKTKKAFQNSLDKLKLDYLDLYLIHQPLGDYYGSWKALEELYEEGKIKSIGVSNFYPDRLTDLCLNVRIKPMVNQVELHPFFQQNDAIGIMNTLGVAPEAWGPLAEAKHDIFNNEKLVEIASKYNKTVAQVILRWNTQRGVVIIPKSVHKNRMEENLDIWDFTISDDDMTTINSLDVGYSEIIDHRDVEVVKFLNRPIHD